MKNFRPSLCRSVLSGTVVTLICLSICSTVCAQSFTTSFGSNRAIKPDMVGYNTDFTSVDAPWTGTTGAARKAAAVKSRPAIVRYPGGTTANYWDVYNARLFRDNSWIDPVSSIYNQYIKSRYTLNWIGDSFLWLNSNTLTDWASLDSAVVASGQPRPSTIFLANMITPGPDYFSVLWNRAVDPDPGSGDWWAMMGDRYSRLSYMLTDAKNNNFSIKYVELGNEYYFGASTTSASRRAYVEPYSAGSFDEDNFYNFERVGAFPDKNSQSQGVLWYYATAANDWGAKIKQAHPGTQVCAIGTFVSPDIFTSDRSRFWNTTALAGLDRTKVDAISLHVYGGHANLADVIGTETQFGSVLKDWQSFWTTGLSNSSLPTNFDWWITEYNVINALSGPAASNPEVGSWGNGLANLYAVHYWLKNNPNVQIALMHELTRAIDGTNIKAFGRVQSTFAAGSNGKTRARTLGMTGIPDLAGTTIPAVAGWVLDTGNGTAKNYVLINFGSATRTLTGLTNLPNAANSPFIRSAASLGQVTDPGETSGTVSSTTSLTLPAYSVTVIKAPAGGSSVTYTRLSGTIIGTAGSHENLGNTIQKGFDGNTGTFFDAPTNSGSWLGLDLGSTGAKKITKIRYFPRATFGWRMSGGIFQGRNSTTAAWTNLYTISGWAPEGVWSETTSIGSTTAFRYIRYLAPNDGYGNVAELEFYTSP
jgi:hypothetical protein